VTVTGAFTPSLSVRVSAAFAVVAVSKKAPVPTHIAVLARLFIPEIPLFRSGGRLSSGSTESLIYHY
jgi:hypothetical protein